MNKTNDREKLLQIERQNLEFGLQRKIRFLFLFLIQYDSVYLTCSKKLTGSQLSLPHGTNKKLKCETKK